MKKMFVMAMISGCLSIPLVALAQPAGGGDLTFTPQNAPPVVFSHNKHLKEQGLKCSGCHYQFFQMAQGSYKMDMGKITKGEFCGRCHSGRVSFDVQDPQNCSRCHQ
ncbi:MAG: hypothetical protein C0390_06220 [Syntrophus sp. (in: bacteria)]|nr:hypothetical protein [Syntrophus sp. (in: bacteria)]